VVGVNHIYMADALNFNAHVFVFPLAMLLSLTAFHLIFRSITNVSVSNVARWLVAIQCISFALAIYQPFAVFGVILPLIGLFRWDRYDLSNIIVIFGLCLICCLLGLLLHKIEWWLLMKVLGREINSAGFQLANLDEIKSKLAAFPKRATILLSGGLMSPTNVFRWVQGGATGLLLFSVVLLAGASIWGKRLLRQGVSLNAARFTLASGLALFVCPLLLWLALATAYFPSRAVAYLGFWLCAIAVATYTLAQRPGIPARMRPLISWTAVIAMVVFAISNTAMSQKIWTDRAQLAESELKLASQILEDVQSLPYYDGGAVKVIGSLPSGYRWGGSLGVSVFHGNNSYHGIFMGGLGTPWRAEAVEISPVGCPAYPSPGSFFIHEDDAHVCLSPQIGIFPLQDCIDLGSTSDERLCRSGETLIRAVGQCDEPALRETYLLVEDPLGASVVFDSSHTILRLNGRCYQAAKNPGMSVREVVGTRYPFGTGPAKAERYYYPIPNRAILLSP